MSKGVQGDGKAVPLHNIKSAVAGWLHGSEDSMSWITQRSELCNWVSQFLQNCSTPFSSSQSGKANCESAFVEKVTKTATRFVTHILTKLNLSSLNSHFVLRQTAA